MSVALASGSELSFASSNLTPVSSRNILWCIARSFSSHREANVFSCVAVDAIKLLAMSSVSVAGLAACNDRSTAGSIVIMKAATRGAA